MYVNYNFKLYKNDDFVYLENLLGIACNVWNFYIALVRRYYKIYGKHPHVYHLQNHYTRLRKRTPRLKRLNSKCARNILFKLDAGYKSFFSNIKTNKKARPPKFIKRQNYSSLEYSDNGWKIVGNTLYIQNKRFPFWKSREIDGDIKQIVVKRTKTGDWYITICVKKEYDLRYPTTGREVGLDFGFCDSTKNQYFLSTSDGVRYEAPQPLKKLLNELRKRSKALSKKKKGSKNREKAKRSLGKLHETITNIRKDFFYKTANNIVSKYDVICIEDLNIKGMKSYGRWGRKVSDLAPAEFFKILEWVAIKEKKTLIKIDRYEPTSSKCSVCGEKTKEKLSLDIREWTCEFCKSKHNRDINAAVNIKNAGVSALSEAV